MWRLNFAVPVVPKNLRDLGIANAVFPVREHPAVAIALGGRRGRPHQVGSAGFSTKLLFFELLIPPVAVALERVFDEAQKEEQSSEGLEDGEHVFAQLVRREPLREPTEVEIATSGPVLRVSLDAMGNAQVSSCEGIECAASR